MRITIELDEDEIKGLGKQVYGSSDIVSLEGFFALCKRSVERGKRQDTIADAHLRGLIVEARNDPKTLSKLVLVGSIMKLTWKAAYPKKR